MMLDVGCGEMKQEGAIGIDGRPLPGVDVVCDLHDGIPFKPNSFDTVVSNHVMEYFDDTHEFLKRIHIVAKDGAEIIIRVPHFSGTAAWEGLGHRKTFGVNLRFEELGDRFIVKEKRLHYFTYIDRTRNWRNRFLSKIIDSLSNAFPGFSNRILSHWIGGYQEVYFKLQVKK